MEGNSYFKRFLLIGNGNWAKMFLPYFTTVLQHIKKKKKNSQ